MIERRLGRGGMGVVYQATQIDLNRPVVLKVLAPDWVGDSEALARFEREARGLSSLQHPNIVTIHDFGKVDGRAFIVMEYVQGETLDRFVRRRNHLTLADFVPIAAQVLKGLGEAHSRGIIHRDIKPANIMLCERQGRANYVKILDFGLAKLVSGSSDITKQNVLGTPTCLSPEQILGEKIDQRVDVYAVGILFYFMLTGVMPFQADNDASVLYKHVHEKPQPIQDLLPADSGAPEGCWSSSAGASRRAGSGAHATPTRSSKGSSIRCRSRCSGCRGRSRGPSRSSRRSRRAPPSTASRSRRRRTSWSARSAGRVRHRPLPLRHLRRGCRARRAGRRRCRRR
ncbi:serine/threonine-protein kinase [Nannocystis pusilla]|uniref:serine/threonine-protein kinase n=1 Tax=Nannocystis pusilla TaxID=889268 RepID=UPI003B805DC1